MIDEKKARDCWATPSELVARIATRLGINEFDLDVCASRTNAKAKNFFDINTNGLLQKWTGNVWGNFPYSDLTPWIKKAISERDNCKAIAMLLPSRTDQKWFHLLLSAGAEIEFIKGRVQFIPPEGIARSSNREASIVVVLRPQKAINPEAMNMAPPTISETIESIGRHAAHTNNVREKLATDLLIALVNKSRDQVIRPQSLAAESVALADALIAELRK